MTFQCWTVLKRTIFLNVTNILKYKELFVEWKGSMNVKGFIRTIDAKKKLNFKMYFIIMPVRRMQNAAIQCVLYLKSSFVWNPFIHTHAVWDCISQELNQAWKIHFSPPGIPDRQLKDQRRDEEMCLLSSSALLPLSLTLNGGRQ